MLARKNILRYLVLLLLVLHAQRSHSQSPAAAPAASTAPATARYAEKFGEAYKTSSSIFKSATANEPQGKLNPLELQAAGGPAGAALKYQLSNLTFQCPGNSFLVGVSSDFDHDKMDRSFSFKCAFLENQAGELLKKSSCSTLEAKTLDAVAEQDGHSKCTDTTFVAGFMRLKFFESVYQSDARYATQCCKLSDLKSHAVYKRQAAACSTLQVQAREDFDVTCPANTVITEVTSGYYSAAKDRAFNFTCCPLEAGAPEAAAVPAAATPTKP